LNYFLGNSIVYTAQLNCLECSTGGFIINLHFIFVVLCHTKLHGQQVYCVTSADFLSNNLVIFNIKGNNYRLVIQTRYQNGIVVILWVGTHAEYAKKVF